MCVACISFKGEPSVVRGLEICTSKKFSSRKPQKLKNVTVTAAHTEGVISPSCSLPDRLFR